MAHQKASNVPKHVAQWISRGESEVQEFKERTSTALRRDGAITGSAMLNTRGGRVLFGVQKSGKIVGQSVSDKTIEDVVAELQRIDPPAFPRVERIPINGDELISVTVDKGSRRPYSYKGKSYRRVGNSNLELSREEYNEMLMEELHATRRWENEVAAGWSVSDLDEVEIGRTVDEAVRRGRLTDPGTRDPAEVLRGLGLLDVGGDDLLRAAVVLFASQERLLPNFPQCRLRLARFRGVDKTEFVDNRQYQGNAFGLLTRADQFLRDHLPVAGRILADVFERQDDPIYPPQALREALANALCHRDYAIGGGSVGVAIFDDRLEITSSGGLHFGLTIEDLYGPHESLPWNPIVASVFYRRGIIETWGRGTLRMAQLTQQAGLPRPEFEATGGAVTVRFRPGGYIAPQRIGQDLTIRQQQILSLLGARGSESLGNIQNSLGKRIQRRGLQADLQFLKNLGLVESFGWGRGARWRLRQSRKKRQSPRKR
jgi:ATP-dependent DNA helicase RecG